MSKDGLFVRRPVVTESEDDILRMQAEWQLSQSETERPAVQIQRMSRKGTNPAPSKPINEKKKLDTGGRFEIDLENITEEYTQQVLFDVQEKNSDWLTSDRLDEISKQEHLSLQYSKDEGFPNILDLSPYYKDCDNRRASTAGKSFFASEFDRIHGHIDEVQWIPPESEPDASVEEDFLNDNERYLASLSAEKVNEFRQEIEERLDPKMIAFLAQRHKKKKEQPATEKPKVSRFKQARQSTADSDDSPLTDPSSLERKAPSPVPAPTEATPSPAAPFVIDDLVKELEVLDEFADRDADEKYNRLATDAVQVDFATKCLRTMLPRQQQNALKLFDNLKHVPDGPEDQLLALARSRIDDIKQLYLEELESNGRRFTQFAAGMNPLVDGCWTLCPLRNVLDVVQKREDSLLTADDVDIVRLSLLWTVLLHAERLSAFYAFAEPNDIYVRLAEVFLLGTTVLEDDVCMHCVSRLMDKYVLKCAIEGRLSLRMAGKVAGLDAFMPFYEDLLKHYESYSLGDVQFARVILIAAYLNSAVGDGLECRFGIWSPKQHTARQMTLKVNDASDLLEAIRKHSKELAVIYEEQHYTQYCSLLGAYAGAIRDEKVTRERNPLMFSIAAEELGGFVERHTKAPSSTEKAKEFDALVEIIRSTVSGKLVI